ncbi:hypothetical protein CFOL_v3_29308 [Cephalotus follicularis]|uniref:Uncharacterized protein n=1 Tax=Cephalotus follicularis TaxID=3775 RepID=A0A1Q3D090_CEPFO|nr:hypothetical protein CFOL_v3_29308 [Cephalotus follicularis]
MSVDRSWMRKRLRIGEARGEDMAKIYFDSHLKKKENIDPPSVVVENIKRYRATTWSTGQIVEGPEGHRAVPLDAEAFTEATEGPRKGKIRGYMTSKKILSQALRAPLAIDDQSQFSCSSQAPLTSPGVDVGIRSKTGELEDQVARLEAKMASLPALMAQMIEMMDARKASQSG